MHARTSFHPIQSLRDWPRLPLRLQLCHMLRMTRAAAACGACSLQLRHVAFVALPPHAHSCCCHLPAPACQCAARTPRYCMSMRSSARSGAKNARPLSVRVMAPCSQHSTAQAAPPWRQRMLDRSSSHGPCMHARTARPATQPSAHARPPACPHLGQLGLLGGLLAPLGAAFAARRV